MGTFLNIKNSNSLYEYFHIYNALLKIVKMEYYSVNYNILKLKAIKNSNTLVQRYDISLLHWNDIE